MSKMLKRAAAAAAVLMFGGCSGEGCSCSGVDPLPGGFAPEQRIENAASVRLTDSGLDFLEANLGGLAAGLIGGDQSAPGVITFPIDESSGSAGIGFVQIGYTICPGGPDDAANPPKCVAEVDLGNANLSITSQNPHNLRITGPLPIRLQYLPIDTDLGDVTLSLNGNGSCPGGSFANITLDVDISIEIDDDPANARYGYSRVRIGQVNISESQLENAIEFCDGGILDELLDLLKGVVIGQLVDPLIETLQETLEEQLCQQAPCPTGTNEIDGVCYNGTTADSECTSIVLGTDGHAELGGLLSSISPGTKGGMNFLFAAGGHSPRTDGSGFAWGDLNPINSGATLGMYGGIEPDPLSGCVALSEMPRPEGIPIPAELTANTVSGWPASLDGPHFGLAVSERFTNYAFNGMYNSGLLCIGVTSDTIGPLLSSGTLGILVPSLKDLGLQREAQAIAITIRPGAPPTVAFGNGTNLTDDPLLRVALPQASLDFYVWSLDRYIRFMSATYDLDIPINLDVTPEGLQPVLDQIGLNNGVVTNTPLLSEDPAIIAAAFAELVAGQLGSALGGGISPIDISGSLADLGLTLEIPPSAEGLGSPGLRTLTSGDDRFLGIFASFSVATMQQMSADTQIDSIDKDVDAEALAVSGDPRTRPHVRVQVSSSLDDGTRAVEYQHRLDGGPWRPFKRDRSFIVDDPWLRLQARHVLEVRSRVVGEPMTLDPTPAVAEIVIDTRAPEVRLSPVDEAGNVVIHVSDLVATDGHAKVRYRLDDGEWSTWSRVRDLAPIAVGDAGEIEIEAADDEGNLATAQQALIRGKPFSGDDACGCRAAGAPTSPPWGLAVFGLGLLGGLVRRLRRGSERAPRPIAPRVSARTARTARTTGRQCLASLGVVAFAGSWAGCSCGDDEVVPTDSYQCVDPCVPLQPGLIGAYTSTAVSGSELWVAGYLEADWPNVLTYGDLVVGRYDGTEVQWEVVDGVPSDPPPDGALYDLNGFRGGQTEPGEDVGLWTSIAIDDAGRPGVAYYDRTNQALKYAKLGDDGWTVATVEDGEGDIGRYAKLRFVGGVPVIAYLVIEPAASGTLRSIIRVATGGGSGFTMEDAVIDTTTPCRERFCTGGSVCHADSGACMAEATGCAECAADEACLDVGSGPSCEAILDGTYLETYPDAVGDYIALAPSGAGVAFYNRILGNVEIARKEGGAWTRLVVDGQDAQGADTGDVGVGLSMYVDGAGDWHLAYVDGHAEALRYARVVGGTQVAGYQIVDDGLSLGGTPFEDGQHIIGDDSSIWVAPGGEVHIAYQDATTGKLRYATGSPDGGGWSARVIEDEAFGGFFSSIVQLEGGIRLAHWWRVGGSSTVAGNVAIVTP